MITSEDHDLKKSSYRYWAFISYSSKDRAWGKWLHSCLENYRLPVQLVEHPIAATDEKAPRRFKPIFWDRAEMQAHHDLGELIENGLAASRYLIVICSPNSAASVWVGKEIEKFRDIHGPERILAVIVSGDPGGEEGSNCFHPALRFREIKAPDARPEGDGKTNAKLMLLATMLGVPFDRLRRREQDRKIKLLSMALAGGGLVLACMGWLAWSAMVAKNDAIERKNEAEKRKDIANITNAVLLLPSREFDRANETLDDISAMRRNWEWHYLRRRLDRRDAIFRLSDVPVESGVRLIVESVRSFPEREATLMTDGKTGVYLVPWEPPVRLPDGFAEGARVWLQPDLKFALVADDEKARLMPVSGEWLKLIGTIWKEPSGKVVDSLKASGSPPAMNQLGEGPVEEARFCGEGSLYLIRGGGEMELWMLDGGKDARAKIVTRRSGDKQMSFVRCSPDAESVIFGGKSSIFRVDPVTLETIVENKENWPDSEMWMDVVLGDDGKIVTSRTVAELWNGKPVGGTNLIEFLPADADADTERREAFSDPDHRFDRLSGMLVASISAKGGPQGGSTAANNDIFISLAGWEGGEGLLISQGHSCRVEGYGPASCIGLSLHGNYFLTLHEDAMVGRWKLADHVPDNVWDMEAMAPDMDGGMDTEQEDPAATTGEETESPDAPSGIEEETSGRLFRQFGPATGDSYGYGGKVFGLPGSRLLHSQPDEMNMNYVKLIEYAPEGIKIRPFDLDEEAHPALRLLSRKFALIHAVTLVDKTVFALVLNQGESLYPNDGGQPQAPEVGENCFVIAWDLETLALLDVYGVGGSADDGGIYTPDGRLSLSLVEAPNDDDRCLVATLPASLQVTFNLDSRAKATNGVKSPDGRRMASLDGSRLKINDPEDGNLLLEMPLGSNLGDTGGMAWSGDGSLLAIAFDGMDPSRIGCMIWDGRDDSLLHPVKGAVDLVPVEPTVSDPLVPNAPDESRKMVRLIVISEEITYGAFAGEYNTSPEKLNSLNGISLKPNTVLAKGSELYVPTER